MLLFLEIDTSSIKLIINYSTKIERSPLRNVGTVYEVILLSMLQIFDALNINGIVHTTHYPPTFHMKHYSTNIHRIISILYNQSLKT